MSKEMSVRSKRRDAKAKEKSKHFGKIFAGITGMVVLLLLGIVVFVNNSKDSYEADTNTVFLLEDGSIVSINMEDFEESTYDKEALESYIQEAVDAYNLKYGEDAVKKESLEVNENTAKLKMKYADIQAFEAFEDAELFCGSIAEAVAAGYTFEGSFVCVTDGTIQECSAEAFMEDASYQVIVIRKDTTVSIEEGKIYYVSAEHVDAVTESDVCIKKGSSLLSLPKEEDSQQGESIVIETEIPGDAVGEDELEVGTEQEIYFDFGDEQIENPQYEDVSTYIIYK